MKYFVKHLSVGLLIVALTGVAVFGKGKTKSAMETFSDDVTVAGTTVKAGDYRLKFNEETGELTIMKGGKVVVKTTGSLQARADKARATTMNFRSNELVSVAFGGERQDVVIGSGGSSTGNDQ